MYGTRLVHVADVPGRRVIGAVTGLGRPHSVEIAPDNRVAFVTLGREKAVAVVDLETQRVLARQPPRIRPTAWGGGRRRGIDCGPRPKPSPRPSPKGRG
jgi:hypothetical protein